MKNKKYLLFFLFITILFLSYQNTFAFHPKYRKSKEVTAEDIPLDFTAEKTTYEYGHLKVWGSVKNKTNNTYKYVKVTFSLWGGRTGTLIARSSTFTDPTEIGKMQIGYIEEWPIKCDPSHLNLIEYKVTGQMQ